MQRPDQVSMMLSPLSLVDDAKNDTPLQKTNRVDKTQSAILSSWYIHSQSPDGIYSFAGAMTWPY